MKAHTLLSVIAFCTVMMPFAASADGQIGVRQIVAPSKERGVDLDVTVWYPAQPGGEPTVLGESVFFIGTPALRDAPIAAGRFPLILLSHGAGIGGTAEAVSWIATPLARQGFIVAAPTHPGNGGKKRSALETVKIWLRPADLTQTLNAMEKDTVFGPHLDAGKTGVLGLSMGGGTALAIAGARLDPSLLAGYCDTEARNPSFCEWMRQSGVDLHAIDMNAAGRDNEDKRIRFAMVIDPAPVDVFDLTSFSKVSIPVDLVNLGQTGALPATVDASKVAKVIPAATYVTIGDASHYSMFAMCKPGAAELADSEKIGDPICSDGGGRSRDAIHQQLIELTGAAFSRALKTAP